MLLSRTFSALRPISHSARILSYARVRQRPGILRAKSSIAEAKNEQSALATSTSQIQASSPEPRLAIVFTCTADGCDHRSAHTFTKRAYERGIVLIQCPSCKNRHLIADNIGWFKDDTKNGQLKNVEEVLRARGERVQTGTLNADGVVEFSEPV